MNRYYTKEDTEVVNNHMKRYTVSLVTREIEIKIKITRKLTQLLERLKLHLSVGEHVQQLELSFVVCGSGK